MLIVRVVAANLGLSLSGEHLGAGRVDVFQNPETRFVGHELGQVGLGRSRIELERGLAGFGQARVVAEERPVAGVDREFLLIEALMQAVAVGDTVRVGDD